MSSELLSTLVQSCGEDWRTKFVLTLSGMARLLAVIDAWEGEDVGESIINMFDTLAALLIGNKEHAQVFRKLNGYGTMLRVMVEEKKLRNDALKVISFAFTLYGEDKDTDSILNDAMTAVYLVDDLNCLGIIFGYWMSQPENRLRVKDSHTQVISEHCLSIFWNLVRSLDKVVKLSSVASQEAEEIQTKAKVCLERLSFKFLEQNLAKVTRLVHTHQLLYERIRDFDLEEFKEPEAIAQLEEHFSFDVLALSDALLAYLSQSDICRRLLKDQSVAADALENRIVMQMSGKDRQT